MAPDDRLRVHPIVFLLVGLLLGFLMLLGHEFTLPMATRLRSAHTRALLVGFVLMMIAGVALLMFTAWQALSEFRRES